MTGYELCLLSGLNWYGVRSRGGPRKQTLESAILIGFVAHGLECSAKLPASGAWDVRNPQHSGIVTMLSPAMDFDMIPAEDSVLGAKMTTPPDHHISDYDGKNCDVGLILEPTEALKKKQKEFRLISSNSGLKNHRASMKKKKKKTSYFL